MAQLAVLEMAGHAIGLMQGARTRGKRPSQMAEALPELQAAVRQLLLSGRANSSV